MGGGELDLSALPVTDRSNKKVSIIGDSISTLSTHNKQGNAIYYNANGPNQISINTMWWGRLIKDWNNGSDGWDSNLLVNNSYSGSTVANGTSPRANQSVVDALSDGTSNPDIVLIFVGTNDYNRNRSATIGNVDNDSLETYIGQDLSGTSSRTSYSNIAQAYTLMLKRVIDKYQTSDDKLEIICLLPFTEPAQIQKGVHYGDNQNATGFYRDTFNDGLEAICEYMKTYHGTQGTGNNDIKCIDTSKCGLPERFTKASADYFVDGGDYTKYSVRSLHPNNAGFELMFNYIKQELEGTYSKYSSNAIPKGTDYLYRIDFDQNGNNITGVLESHLDGSAYTSLVSKYRVEKDGPNSSKSSTGNSNWSINAFWDFDPDTGLGPFNSFYAAINIKDSNYSNPDDSKELRLNDKKGTVAYVLDPYNLKKTLKGTMFSTDLYNVMLVIPTVYWKSVGVSGGQEVSPDGDLASCSSYRLYLSNKDSYTTDDNQTAVTGMHANGHTDGYGDTGNVKPYIAIGVYEAYATSDSSDSELVSQSGKVPTVNKTLAEFKTLAGNNNTGISNGTGSYLLWGYDQWQLYKMMAFTIMGTENAQGMIGRGLATGSFNSGFRSETGTVDTAGSYFGTYLLEPSRTTASKLLLENTWGSVVEFLGDVKGTYHDSKYHLEFEAGGIIENFNNASNGWYSKTWLRDNPLWGCLGYFDTGDYTGANDQMSLDISGDKFVITSPQTDKSVRVGGAYNTTGNRAGISTLWMNSVISEADSITGSRIMYLMDAAAVEVKVSVSTTHVETASLAVTKKVGSDTPTNVADPIYVGSDATFAMNSTNMTITDGETVYTYTANPTTGKSFNYFMDELDERIQDSGKVRSMVLKAVCGTPEVVSVIQAAGGTLTIHYGSDATVSPGTSTYSVKDNVLTISTGNDINLTVTATPNNGVHFGVFLVGPQGALVPHTDTNPVTIENTYTSGNPLTISAAFVNYVYAFKGDDYTISYDSKLGAQTIYNDSVTNESAIPVVYQTGTVELTITAVTDHQINKVYAGMTELTGSTDKYTVGPLTSDTYVTVLTDNDNTVTFTRDNVKIETEHEASNLYLPTEVTVTPIDNLTDGVLESIKNRASLSVAILGKSDVRLNVPTMQTVPIPVAALTLFKGSNGDLYIDSLNANLVFTRAALSDIGEAIEAGVGENLIIINESSLLTVSAISTSVPEAYSSLIPYSQVFNIDVGVVTDTVTYHITSELGSPMTITLDPTTDYDNYSIRYLEGTGGMESLHSSNYTFDATLFGLYAIVEEYTVRFDTAGLVLKDSVNVARGSTLDPGSLTAAGYTFAGWYKDPTFDTPWSEQSIVSVDNMTLYAKWNVWTLTVTFEPGTGSGTMEQQTIRYSDGSRTLNPNAFTKTGYVFDHWTSDTEETYDDRADMSELILAVDSEITLAAEWREASVPPSPVNPNIYEAVSDDGEFSDKEVSSIISQMKNIASHSKTPILNVTAEGQIHLTSELFDAMINYGAKLVFKDKNVTIDVPSKTLAGIGKGKDAILMVDTKDISEVDVLKDRHGVVYDITMVVNGQTYKELFAEPIDVSIICDDLKDAGKDLTELFYVNGSVLEKVDITKFGDMVWFSAPHLSRYALVYDRGATVSVNISGGTVSDPGDGWKYSGGYYSKKFAVGSTVTEILDDLGSISKSWSVRMGQSSTSDVLEEGGMTIVVKWVSIVDVLLVIFVVITVILLLLITFYRKGTGRRS